MKSFPSWLARHARRVLCLILTGVLLLGCDEALSATPAVADRPAHTRPASLPTIAPESLPTAAPLWLPTPTPVPTRTVAYAQPASDTRPTREVPDASLVAEVNGVPITKIDYYEQLDRARIAGLKSPGVDIRTEEGRRALQELEARVLGWIIDKILIKQAATAEGVIISEEQIQAQIDTMRKPDPVRFDRWLAANGLTPDTLRDQLEVDLTIAAMRDRVTASLPRTAAQYRVRHILLSERSAASEVHGELLTGADFAMMARKHSEDTATRDGGGDLGFLPMGTLPPSIEQAVLALKEGQTSDIIEGESGFHIIQLVEFDPNRAIPDELWPVVQQSAFDEWLATRRASADIRRYLN